MTRSLIPAFAGMMIILLLHPSPTLAARSETANLDVTSATLVTDVDAFQPGKPFTAALHLKLAEDWHTYTEEPGDAGMPTTIEWTLPEGFSAGGIQWPPHETFSESGLTTYGFKDEVWLPVQITPPADAQAGTSYTLKAQADWLVCKDICIPERAELSVTLTAAAEAVTSGDADRINEVLATVVKKAPASPVIMSEAKDSGKVNGRDPSALPQDDKGLLSVLIFAFIGGLILNLMPCVFPVLSLKALAIARKRSLQPVQIRMEGVAYTLGVLLTFGVIAGLLIALSRAGEAIGWGYQMQSAAFVAVMIYLMFAIGLNLSGLFEVPVLLGSVGTELSHEPSAKGSFLTGIFATLVATPCTAPFMASAVGYALGAPPVTALLVFLSLGLGLAFPFLLISFVPRVLHILPKPGAWMQTLKEFLAFPMYASVVWLLWVLTAQVGASGVAVVLLGMLAVIFALWMRRWFTRGSPAYRISALAVIGLSIVGSVFYVRMLDASPQMNMSPLAAHGEPYSTPRLQALRDAGTPVFVDATAAWCLTCQVNYRVAISSDLVQQAFKDRGIVFMVADWTRRDDAITEWLSSFGYKGVPLYVYYPPNGEPRVLPQLLTPDIILAAIK